MITLFRFSRPWEDLSPINTVIVLQLLYTIGTNETLTNKVIGGDEYAAQEQYSWGDAVVHSKHHVVNNRLVNQVTDFHEARHRRHQAKHCHCKLIFYFRRLKKKRTRLNTFISYSERVLNHKICRWIRIAVSLRKFMII